MIRALRTLIPALALLPLAVGCGEDDTNDNAAPTVVAGEALCSSVQGEVILTYVSFTVEDADGVMDLGDPVMLVEASRLTPELEPVEDAERPENPLRARFVWEQGTNGASERIYCGEAGTDLMVSFEIRDMAGFPTQEATLQTQLD